jgi:hypothetical protein
MRSAIGGSESRRTVLHTYILYGSNSLYHDVLIATVSCHGLRPPNHFIGYIVIRQQDWRRSVSLVVDRIGYLSARFLGESLVYILREKSGRTEESIGYWVTRGALVCLFASGHGP